VVEGQGITVDVAVVLKREAQAEGETGDEEHKKRDV
jgi:hypothetical protein